MFYQQPQCGPLQPDLRWQGAGLASVTTFDQSERDVFGALKLSRSGTILRAVRTGGQGLSQNGGSNFWNTATANALIGTGASFSFALTFALNSLGQTNRYLMAERDGGGGQSALIYGYVANTVELFSTAYSGSDPRAGSGIVINDLLTHTVVYTYDGTTYAGYLDGRRVFSVARTFSFLPMTSGVLGGSTPSSTDVSDITVLQHARFSKGLTDLAARELSGNPWALFYDEDEEEEGVFAPAAGGTTVSPSQGVLTLTVYAPTISQPHSASPTAGALILTGYAPTIAQSVGIAPSPGALALVGYAPTITQLQSITPTPGAIVLAGYAPAITQPRAITLVAGALVLTGYAPTISQSLVIAPPFYGYTIMSDDPIHGAVPALSSVFYAAAGTMRGSNYAATILSAAPIHGQGQMTATPIYGTANLL